jgi:hypothetical protein
MEMSDTTTYAKGTLAPLRRSVKQGPAAIELAFEGGKATGSVTMGAPKAVSADLGGELYADGSGAFESLAALPLAEGYAFTYRNFDVMKSKPSLKQGKVVGAEQVTVAAGTFDAWKVETGSAEGEPGGATFWVDKATRKVVKVKAVLAGSGAVMETEMQK